MSCLLNVSTPKTEKVTALQSIPRFSGTPRQNKSAKFTQIIPIIIAAAANAEVHLENFNSIVR